MPSIKLKRKRLEVDGHEVTGLGSQPEREPATEIGTVIIGLSAAFQTSAAAFIDCHVAALGLAWLIENPGKRLPGGFSNKRIQKKRRDFLLRWEANGLP